MYALIFPSGASASAKSASALKRVASSNIYSEVGATRQEFDGWKWLEQAYMRLDDYRAGAQWQAIFFVRNNGCTLRLGRVL